MRQRTTWNSTEIKNRQSSMGKTADPYLMNQDHVRQNPPADKYMNGTPSSWAEDVHEPNEWEKEYSGGSTKRNEIGEPEFRPETFNHPEKTAAARNAVLLKKADICVKIARTMLGSRVAKFDAKRAEEVVEAQAVALMHIPDADLVATFNRLAGDADVSVAGQEQQQQAGQQQEQQAAAPVGGQQQQQQQAAAPVAVETVPSGGEEWGTGGNAVGKSARGHRAQDQGQDEGQQQQGKEQSFDFQANLAKTVAAAVATALKQAWDDQQQQGQQAQAGAPVLPPPVAMFPPAEQQQQDQGQQQAGQMPQMQMPQDQGQGQQQQMAADPCMSDDALLDNMMAPPGGGGDMGMGPTAEGDIEMEAPAMDMGASDLGPEDAVLKQLFANDDSQAQEEIVQQDQGKQAGNRTASTRTVGTKPTGGVSRVGGVGAPQSKTASVDQLSSLWATAPDVSEHFGSR